MGNSISKSYLLYLLPLFIISLFAIACQNCTSTNAENKSSKSNNSVNKVVTKDSVSKEYLLGKVNPVTDAHFITVDQKYASRKGFYLRKEAYDAFVKMYDAALKDGIKLSILSAFRSFNEQKEIWEGKWTGKVLYYGKNIASSYPDPVERSKYVLKYSSMPGTSRHHWGTDMDMNSLELSYYKTDAGKKLYKWLTDNAFKFGFCQPYTAKDTARTNGYEEEKWHWSYLPLSLIYLQQYKDKISYDDLVGFAGCETARKIDIIKSYVLSVNKKCQ
jgi:LAS superfamily LD-carboxypeptidase LdcB